MRMEAERKGTRWLWRVAMLVVHVGVALYSTGCLAAAAAGAGAGAGYAVGREAEEDQHERQHHHP